MTALDMTDWPLVYIAGPYSRKRSRRLAGGAA